MLLAQYRTGTYLLSLLHLTSNLAGILDYRTSYGAVCFFLLNRLSNGISYLIDKFFNFYCSFRYFWKRLKLSRSKASWTVLSQRSPHLIHGDPALPPPMAARRRPRRRSHRLSPTPSPPNRFRRRRRIASLTQWRQPQFLSPMWRRCSIRPAI